MDKQLVIQRMGRSVANLRQEDQLENRQMVSKKLSPDFQARSSTTKSIPTSWLTERSRTYIYRKALKAPDGVIFYFYLNKKA
ncbi:hypothetical protein [Paenibacillus lautus]|uniref:hypothetical protein n=1 Tax=Paenibacillus lautus TaxID=1401 RepID=UPI000FD87A08|nr:hypothetical protein [Paenibacillus lautus]